MFRPLFTRPFSLAARVDATQSVPRQPRSLSCLFGIAETGVGSGSSGVQTEQTFEARALGFPETVRDIAGFRNQPSHRRHGRPATKLRTSSQTDALVRAALRPRRGVFVAVESR